jgi:hypothetical protein
MSSGAHSSVLMMYTDSSSVCKAAVQMNALQMTYQGLIARLEVIPGRKEYSGVELNGVTS